MEVLLLDQLSKESVLICLQLVSNLEMFHSLSHFPNPFFSGHQLGYSRMHLHHKWSKEAEMKNHPEMQVSELSWWTVRMD